MSETKELIERLSELHREMAGNRPVRFVRDVFIEAASRLASQAEEIERLKDEVLIWRKSFPGMGVFGNRIVGTSDDGVHFEEAEHHLARLTRERDEALEAQRALSFDSDRECRSSARLAYQFARALEALKPFAALMTDWDGGSGDGSCGNETMPVLVKIGDLRRARSVLQSSSDSGQGDE